MPCWLCIARWPTVLSLAAYVAVAVAVPGRLRGCSTHCPLAPPSPLTSLGSQVQVQVQVQVPG